MEDSLSKIEDPFISADIASKKIFCVCLCNTFAVSSNKQPLQEQRQLSLSPSVCICYFVQTSFDCDVEQWLTRRLKQNP